MRSSMVARHSSSSCVSFLMMMFCLASATELSGRAPSAVGSALRRDAVVQTTEAPCFILPIPGHGPTNQAVSIREAVALASVLECSVLVYGINNHLLEWKHQKNGKQTYIPFDAVFDRSAVSQQVAPILTVDEAVAAGWDKQADTFIDWTNGNFAITRDGALMTSMAGVTLGGCKSCWDFEDADKDRDAPRVPGAKAMTRRVKGGDGEKRTVRLLKFGGEKYRCTADDIDSLRAYIRQGGSRYIAIYTYPLILGAFQQRHNHDQPLDHSASACAEAYGKTMRYMTKSPIIKRIARDFIARHIMPSRGTVSNSSSHRRSIGAVFSEGDESGYVAVHVRPKDDKCVKLWQEETYDARLVRQICRTKRLYESMAPVTIKAMKRHSMTGAKVFAMSHPAIRHHIKSQFRDKGINPIFLDLDDLPHNLTSQIDSFEHAAVSLLMLVEQEVAEEAALFIGTESSSITRAIVHARSARGVPSNRTVVMYDDVLPDGSGVSGWSTKLAN